MLRLHCRCGKKLKLADQLLGRPAACPQCRKRVRVVAVAIDPERDRIDGLFLIESGPSRVGEQIFLGGKQAIEVGRADQAPLRLQAPAVRDCHARVIPSPYGWRVEEADADGPVLINGRRVRGHNLLDGDLLQVGEFGLRYFTDYTSTASRKLLKLENEAAIAAGRPVTAVTATRVDFVAAQEEALLAQVADDSVVPLAADSSADAFSGLATAEAAAAPLATPVPPAGEDPYAFAPDEGAAPAIPPPRPRGPVGRTVVPGPAPVGDVVCPSCGKSLGKKARICVTCGINAVTGRPIITSLMTDVNELYERAHQAIWAISWVSWWGIFPFASEAFGTKKPHVVRSILLLNVLFSSWFIAIQPNGADGYPKHKNLMLWSGDAPIPAEELEARYTWTDYGDTEAFEDALAKIKKEQPDIERDKAIVAAHESLRPDQHPYAEFQLYQLLTHAFLHDGFVHLAGNMLFLLVFGSRVNALIGNLWTIVVYFILAIGSGMAQAISMQGETPGAGLGASGAVMGLAGMYFVLFPVHKVHMAAWRRWIFSGLQLRLKLFSVRGFWVVGAYIGLDVLATAAGSEDDVAHWAHLGGFGVGVILALLLLVSRLVDARGGDILSVVLGRRAWAIVGRPGGAAG